jgi:CRP-like cAMP-binding protein
MPPCSPLQPQLDNLALLRRHPLFGEIEPGHLRRLCAYATTRKLNRGTTLFVKGDPGTALFAVRTGTIKISVPAPDGREAVFNLLQDGDIFGEIALLDGQPRTADAIAVTDCELMCIDRRDFLALVQSEPKLASRLIELLCARLRFASQHLEEVVFLSMPARLARTLLRLGEQEDETPRNHKVAITQREIAHMLGMTRESINKQLRDWASRDWIRLQRGQIVILAPESLTKVAERPAH